MRRETSRSKVSPVSPPDTDAYTYETMTFKEPLFNSIDTAIVLTMENSSRRPSFMWQLNNYRPCRKVVIQNNRGRAFKPKIVNSAEDLFHAFVTACKCVKKGPVLILEDDVCFKIAEADAWSIDQFMTSNTSWDVYSLGSFVTYCDPRPFREHVRVWSTLWDAHAWILSDEFLQKFDDAFFDRVFHLMRTQRAGHDHILSKLTKNFIYYKPVAFQTHPLTENSAIWLNCFNSAALRLFRSERDPFTIYNVSYKLNTMGGICPAGCVLLLVVLLVVVAYGRRWCLTPRRHLPQRALLVLAGLYAARGESLHLEDIPEARVQPKAGDIVYFSTTTFLPIVQLIQLYNNTQFDHVGICIEKENEIYIAEAFWGQKKKLRKYATRIHTFNERKGTCAIRQLLLPLSEEQNRLMLEFFKQATIETTPCWNFFEEHVFRTEHIPAEIRSCKALVYNMQKAANIGCDEILFPCYRRYSKCYAPLRIIKDTSQKTVGDP